MGDDAAASKAMEERIKVLEEAVRNSSSQGQARWTSLLKIGFGDFVPGSSKAGSLNMQLYVDYCYLLVGMGIVAMNYYL